jgi:hypothetical protein
MAARNSILALAAVACLSATPAGATLMLANYSGSVGAGSTDATDFFGLGSGLVGADFTARFLYDSSLGLVTQSDHYDSRVGGPFFGGADSPILAASLTINGRTDLFDAGYDGAVNVFSLDGFAQTFAYINYFSGPGPDSTADWLQLYVLNAPTPVTLETPYTGGNLPVSPLDDLERNEAFRHQFSGGVELVDYDLSLLPTSVTLAFAPTAVPEPSVWASLLLGLFGVGFALRRRGRHPVPSAL